METSDLVFFASLAGVASLFAAVFSFSRMKRNVEDSIEIVVGQNDNGIGLIPLLGTFSFDSSDSLIVQRSEQGARLLQESSLATLLLLPEGSKPTEHGSQLENKVELDSSATMDVDLNQPSQRAQHSNSSYFRNAGLHVLFHLTRTSNWQSIVTSDGLLSKRRLKESGIQPEYLSDDLSQSLDARKNLDTYVHLSFVYSSPMFYRFIDRSKNMPPPELLVVHLDALDLPDTLFTNANAAKNSTRPSNRPEIIASSDLKRILRSVSGEFVNPSVAENKESLQSEALVRSGIPMRYIIGKFTYQAQKNR